VKVTIVREAGYEQAAIGLSLSYDIDSNSAQTVMRKLAGKDGGHNKFLESIVVWIDVTAPRYWWAQMATYRCGTTWQSESTMHTLTRKKLMQSNFQKEIPFPHLLTLNRLIDDKQFDTLKNILPEGFLQRRIGTLNYKSLRTIILQRHKHKLREWQVFCDAVLAQLERPELLGFSERGGNERVKHD
jgi:hypothetical protein